MQSEPEVYLMIPPPSYGAVWNIQPDIINQVYPQLIPEIANELGFKVINLFDALGGVKLEKPELISDLCHPTK